MAPSPARRLDLLLATVVLLLALALRVHDLYNLPIFFDESSHVDWAIRFAAYTPAYPFLMDGKFLLIVLISLLGLRGPGALWLARSAIGLAGVLSSAASLALGRRLAGRPAGLAAGLIYALLPQAVLFERQVLADPLMSAFGLVSAVAAFRLVRGWRWDAVLALGLGLAAATLAKLFGLIYLAYPAVSLLLIAARGARLALIRRYAAGLALAALAGGALLLVLAPRLGVNDGHLANQQIGFIGCPAILCRGSLTEQLKSLTGFYDGLKEEAGPYYGWPLLALSLLSVAALPWQPPARRRDWLAWAAGSAAMLIAFALTAKGFVPPRYTIFMAGPLTVLAAAGATDLAVQSARYRLAPAAWLAVCAAVILQPGLNSVQIAFDPARAALTSDDRSGLYAPSAGEGIRDAAAAIGLAAQRRDPPPVVLVGAPSFTMVAAYFDRSRVDVRPLGEAFTADLGGWLAAGQAIYFFDGADAAGAAGLSLQPLGRFPQTGPATVAVSRVTGLGAARRSEFFANLFIQPDKLADAYSALSKSLPAGAPLTLLVYPPHQAAVLRPLLADRAGVRLTPIGDAWPLDKAAVESELANAAGAGGPIQIAFLEETKGDPSRTIETWLDTHLFRLGEAWFGPVRLASYAPSASLGQALPASATFGQAIQLQTVEVFDPAPEPGGLLRLRLTWRALAPIPQVYKVFTHLFTGDRIVAQHDGQPVGELRPTTTWQAGETIVDQFAIQLPPDAPAGAYQLRVGVYDLATQARLPMTLPDGSGGEFWVGGVVTIH
jgi:hypothetical protein